MRDFFSQPVIPLSIYIYAHQSYLSFHIPHLPTSSLGVSSFVASKHSGTPGMVVSSLREDGGGKPTYSGLMPHNNLICP